MSDGAQKNYESVLKMFKDAPATDRTIPVEEEVEIGTETTIPYENIKDYVEKYLKNFYSLYFIILYLGRQ